MTAAPGDVLTIDELAAYLKISKSTLYKLAQDGALPGLKVGKRWRFHKEAIDAWLKSQSPTPESRERKSHNER